MIGTGVVLQDVHRGSRITKKERKQVCKQRDKRAEPYPPDKPGGLPASKMIRNE